MCIQNNYVHLYIHENNRETPYDVTPWDTLKCFITLSVYNLNLYMSISPKTTCSSHSLNQKVRKIYLTRFLFYFFLCFTHDVNTEWLLWDSFMTFQCFPVIFILLFNSLPYNFPLFMILSYKFWFKKFFSLLTWHDWGAGGGLEMNSEIYWKDYCLLLHKRWCLLSCLQ